MKNLPDGVDGGAGGRRSALPARARQPGAGAPGSAVSRRVSMA